MRTSTEGPSRVPARRVGAENFRYQHDLAESLRADLGLADAVAWCQEHGWEGVIRQLLPKRSRA